MEALITEHACQRYVSRIARDITLDEAREELALAYENSTTLRQRSGHGHALCDVTHPRPCTLIIKPDIEGNGPVLVTVIPTKELHESLDELEAYLQGRSEEQRRWEDERDYGRATASDAQIRVLSLECQLIKEELALARVKFQALRDVTQEKYSGKTRAFRWAMRGLLGQVSIGEALVKVRDAGSFFFSPEFLDVEFEK